MAHQESQQQKTENFAGTGFQSEIFAEKMHDQIGYICNCNKNVK